MTAPSDALLVSAVLAGDREAFAAVYDRYADRLHDFAYSMLRHREDAADAVADAFVTTAERLDQLRDPERLRPWLYAVVRRECLRRLKARSRTAYGGDDDLLDLPDPSATPETLAEQEALRSLVWDAAAGLNERDRAMLDLHLRQGLDGAELGEAMGMSADNAYVGLSRLRDQVERSIGALLVARTSRDDCTELSGVLGDWDGELTPLIRKRVARHVDGCAGCSVRRAAMASPAALLAGVPAFAAPALLRDRVLEDSRLVSALASRRSGGGPGAGGGGSENGGRGRRRVVAGLVLALLLLLVVVAVRQGRTSEDPATVAEDLGVQTSSAPTAAASPSLDPGLGSTPVPGATLSPSEQPSVEVSVTPSDDVTPEPSQPTTSEPSPSAAVDDPTTPTATPSPTPPATPGRLTASPRTLDLGTAGTRTVTVTNRGGSPVSFDITPAVAWLSVSPDSGTLKPGQSRSVTIAAERAGLPEGTTQGSLSVTWAKGTVPVTVIVSRETPPVIGAVSVVRTTCGPNGRTVVVGVPVDDESGVASASVGWNGAGATGTGSLKASGAVWAGAVGPFPVKGTVQLVLAAADTRGNTAQRTASITVDPCPQ